MAVLRRSSTASEPLRLLLLALLACCAAASICDTVNCGRGNCTELSTALFPGYECHCDPGWSRALEDFHFSPCIIPQCSFDGACLNLSLSPPIVFPPKDFSVCAFVSCGAGGACKTGGGNLYTCECQPGYANLLNLNTLPCVKNCFFGQGCSALGLAPPAPAPASQPSPPISPAPTTVTSHDSSGPSAPPSGTQGSVASWRLLQQLLLVTLAVVHVM